ncbi:MAG: hypothetical protein Q9209_004335 [Squamulea sp. 1 TL-2023]
MSDEMASLRTAKKELRRQIKQRLSQSRTDTPGFRVAHAAKETLVSLPEYQSAKRISVYLSMPRAELSTGSIVVDALQAGKEVYVPYISKVSAPSTETSTSVMDMVALHSQEDFDTLEPNSWGIPTPSADTIANRKRCLGLQYPEQVGTEKSGDNSENLEIVVLPGMAFDRKLSRLGHGKGYYDRFLTQYQELLAKLPGPENEMPFLVGLALDEQVLPEGQGVPTDASDWRLDALIAGSSPVWRR